MKHEIKYDKNVVCFKPFIDAAKSLIAFNKITRLRGYKVKKGLTEQTDGSTVEYTDGTFVISLLTNSYVKSKKEYRPKPLHYILDTLAHELAHTVHWEHTYKHYELHGKIASKFAKVIKQLGIKDTSRRFG